MFIPSDEIFCQHYENLVTLATGIGRGQFQRHDSAERYLKFLPRLSIEQMYRDTQYYRDTYHSVARC